MRSPFVASMLIALSVCVPVTSSSAFAGEKPPPKKAEPAPKKPTPTIEELRAERRAARDQLTAAKSEATRKLAQLRPPLPLRDAQAAQKRLARAYTPLAGALARAASDVEDAELELDSAKAMCDLDDNSATRALVDLKQQELADARVRLEAAEEAAAPVRAERDTLKAILDPYTRAHRAFTRADTRLKEAVRRTE